MNFLEVKDLLINQVKNINYILLIIVYLLSVISAIIFVFIYFNKKENNIVIENDFIDQEESTISGKEEIVVDLSGAVNLPGVYRLENGSRLSDLIKVAGGFNEDASEKIIGKIINLSQKLSDSQKIYIPYKWDESEVIDTAPLGKIETIVLPEIENTSNNIENNPDNEPKTKININTASAEELDSLQGIGPAYAQKIISNRPYSNVEDFKQKSGVPSATILKFATEIIF
ncbi:hypothetical protein A2V49_02665 [candidate division WWE3 bacterium RBG_19FT_COMBO_34_6]|uniref:Soluble ligand binding domain-containing protein n=1 Tax=candidate division WWE3 bacterium RBG_19FT_COMBO_34_6 TaxID=1802612 RepID=A0A1F4UKL7_UNCKA|nr:MAG: hypothetical protein A2V49_02665 [candidate division WWE3 bacterium RBG_19FT_COMBO_34_6]